MKLRRITVFCLKPLVLLIALLYLLPSAPALGQERKIKPGDVIEITVSEHAELNQSVLVNPEGKMDYPCLEDVPIDGLTLSRLRELLVNQLSRSLEARPFVVVRFAESYPIAVTVLGHVVKPGSYMLHNTSRLQSAIGEAGGFAPGALLSQIKLLHKDGEVINNQTVNLEMFYLKGDLSALPILKDGDTIVVPGNPLTATVKVLGNVQKPGSFDVAFRMSLLDVIALAGGTTNQADLRRVKVISFGGQNVGETKVINVEALLQASSVKNISVVAPGDVVYVPQRKNHLGKVVSVLRDLSIFASLYILISNTNGR
jgi:protein involved in polysaccharide export with SLBB domain